MSAVRRGLRVVLFGLFLVANPAYVTACGSEDEGEFTFGEAEMLALLDEANATAGWEFDGYVLDVELEQQPAALASWSAPAGLVQSAHACSSRSFVKDAAACVDTTELLVEGSATVLRRLDDGTEEAVATVPVEGSMMVAGFNLDGAALALWFDGGFVSLIWPGEGDFELDSFTADSLGDEALAITYNRN